jgi:hypothetical protein
MSIEETTTPTPAAEVTPVPPPTVMILGPFLDGVIEPIPVAADPLAPVTPGRRQVVFAAPPTTPGGNVHLQVLPPLATTDKLPLSVYAFFVQPAESVPAPVDRTPDWFFKSGSPSGSIHIGIADANGNFTIPVTGVKPSLLPYFVQIVLEFPLSS